LKAFFIFIRELFMPNFLSRLMGGGASAARPDEGKASRARPMIALHSAGRPIWTAREGLALAKEGYRRNAVAYRCVRLVAEAAASVELLAYRDGKEQADHPLLGLLHRPNPHEAGRQFFETIYAHLLISGNAYLELAMIGDDPRELYALRPDRMTAIASRSGWPEAYEYNVGADRTRFDMPEEGQRPILHLTMFDPVDDHYGMAPLLAAQMALDTHNAASGWNKALLDNAARPSGALVYTADGGNLSDEQFNRLKEELEQQFSGSANAGRPILLEGGLDWKPLALTPKDMDFLEAKAAAAREIALAFGVPPFLLGLPGDNTYANYAEANRAFWRQTVLPLVRRTSDSISHWLVESFPDTKLLPDLDRVEALSDHRESLWRSITAANFLTSDEKRAALDYGPLPDGTGSAMWQGGAHG
jgi:HK97 family phage portal protein